MIPNFSSACISRALLGRRPNTFTAAILLFSSLGAAAFSQTAEPLKFIEEHCAKCHGAEKQKGDRRFDGLTLDFDHRANAWAWEEVLDLINVGEMPPKDEPRPDPAAVRQIVGWITDKLDHSVTVREAREATRLRRMNRPEYRNTIRDLLQLNMESFDPAESFPADEREEGFENIGGKLVLSDHLLERYLEAATRAVDKAVNFQPPIEPISERLVPNDYTDRVFHFRPQIWFVVNVGGKYIDFAHGDDTSDRLYAKRFAGAPADGYYTIRVTAEGVNRINRYDPSILKVDPTEPIKLQLLATDPKAGNPGRKHNNSDRVIANVPLADHEIKTYEFRVWLDRGFVPIVRYPNGPTPFKDRLTKLTAKYHMDVVPTNWRSGTDTEPAQRLPVYLSDAYEGPRIRFYGLEIQGPESSASPPPSHQAIFGPGRKGPEEIDPEKLIADFGARAFRRPLAAKEQERYLAYFKRRRETDESVTDSLKALLTAILASPHFIYVAAPAELKSPPAEPARPKKSDLHALAARLSYFLWSSMPDRELFAAAAGGKLGEPEELKRQLHRMLADTKSRALADNFTDSWLRLNRLGELPPDTEKFALYHDRKLQPLMKEETRLYFQHVLSNNRPITDFIDSDYSFVNRYLADLYDLKGVTGDAFEKITFPARSARGGVFGQASVLTATSNGVETSPVVRGVWVLENILGTPPSPPPASVEPLEPDTRGATTIREQLQKHRKVETCASCHRKIDPLGFALENFDPIGRYRANYPGTADATSREIETAGELPGGERFNDLAELRTILLGHKKLFTKCLTEKMLTYALGRKLTFADRTTVRQICDDVADRGDGLRDLVELVVLSDAFREI